MELVKGSVKVELVELGEGFVATTTRLTPMIWSC